MSRLTKTLTTVSAIMCGVAVTILGVSYCLEGPTHAVAVTSSLSTDIVDGKVEFGSQSHPSEGNVPWRVALEAGGATVRNSDWRVGAYGIGQETFTDTRGNFIARQRALVLPGIRFVHKRWRQEPALWKITVSLWYPVLVLAGLPAVSVFRWWRGGGPSQRGAGDGGPGPHLSTEATAPAAPDHER